MIDELLTKFVTLHKFYPLTARYKQIFSLLLKLGILILAFAFAYYSIIKNGNNLQQFQQLIARISYPAVVITMLLQAGLMLMNWFLESLKWRYLTRQISPMSTWQAIEAVFCGLTLAVFTPNRLGEYAGRVMFLPNRKRVYGVFAMAVGSFGQNVVTNILGATAVIWFSCSLIHLNDWVTVGIAATGIIIIATMSALYFNIRWFVWLLNRIKFLRKFHRFFDIIGKYKTAELIVILGFCIARFATFTLQYYLLIHLLIPQIPMLQITFLIFIFFFIQSAIPSLDILDIGVRTITAGKLFSYVTDQQIAVIVAISVIYIINLIVPAIMGSAAVFKLKFFDRNN
jgi:hypothetical protein